MNKISLLSVAIAAGILSGCQTVRSLPPGDVVLTKTMLVTAADSGVTFRGADDGSTRITAGISIDGWMDRGNGVWGAKLPLGADGKPIYTETLFVNGRRAQRARWPDSGYFRVTSISQTVCQASATGFRQFAVLKPSEVQKLAAVPADELKNAQFIVHVKWDSSRYPIAQLEGNVLTLDNHQLAPWKIWQPGDLYALENLRSAFDAPGEWFYDVKAGEVLYRPLPGEKIAAAVAPRDGLETLLAVKGATDVTFENVTFCESAPVATKGPTALPSYQAAASVAVAAVTVDFSTNIVFRNCRFTRLGSYALWFREGVKGGGAYSCEMTDLGAGGVRIGVMDFPGRPKSNQGLPPKDKPTNVPRVCTEPWMTSHVTVDDCLIADGGKFHPAGVGVLLAHASDCTVTHNEIRDLFYTGVSVGWIWGYAGSVAQRNEISFNHIHDIGKGELADMGGIYTLGTSFGTVVSNNVIHAIHTYSYGGWGLYPDEGSQGIVFENNLVYETDDASFHQHYGIDNVLRNNILVDSKAGQIAVTRAEPHRSLTAERNIVIWTKGDAFNKYGGTKSEKSKIDWRNNLWWRTDGKDVFNGTPFADWQKRVKDEGSLFADPGFTDWQKRDFTLKSDSPAFKVGFKPFDPSLAGRRRATATTDLESACWFYAGFDSPVRIAGGCFPADLKPEGFREGRFGKGYYFHSPTENLLPPMATLLASPTNFVAKGGQLESGKTLKFSGGTLATVSRHLALRNGTPWVSTLTGYTGSFYVKGPKDATLAVRVDLKPLDKEQLAKIEKRCRGGDWHKLKDDPLRADICSNKVWKLTGDWQRVYAYAQLDNRAQVVGRDVALAITCDQAIELKDFQLQQTSEYPRVGDFSPTVFTDGGTKTKIPALVTTDPSFVSGFPTKEGSFVVWVKCFAADAAPSHPIPVWGLAHPWHQDWGFNGYTMKVMSAKDCPYQDWNKFTMPFAWRHYAATWKDGTVKLYIDGVLQKDRTMKGLAFDDMKTGGVNIFRLGSRADGDGAADALIDDFAIFSTALDDAAIAGIVQSNQPLFAGSKRLLADPIDLTTFFRNQENAALRTPIYAPAAGRFTVKAKLCGETLAPQTLDLAQGHGRIVIPFNPALYPIGSYDWEFSLVGSDGQVALARSGKLQIKGRLERDTFRFVSWGGMRATHDDFLKLAGMNTLNCNTRLDVVRASRNGLFTNIRYENNQFMKDADYDHAKLAAKVPKDLAYAEGLHTWVSTLVNSEVYGAGNIERPKNSVRFAQLAEKELGFKPDWTFVHNPAMVNYSKLGEKCPVGIIDGLHPTFRSMRWFMDTGDPCYRLNEATMKRIHELSPDNCVWTEPIVGPGGMGRHVDMMADWLYEYDSNVTLSQLRGMAGMQRGIQKPFAPTLSGNYWPEQKGTNPANPATKVKTDMGQSCDENMIKGWMMIGAVKAAHLHFFAADSWEFGVSTALTWAKEPKKDVPQIAEPDAPRRYGEFYRTKLEPAAYLLGNLDNVRAPVAFVITAESEFASAFGWNLYWYPRDFTRVLCQTGVPFDTLHEHEVTEEVLSQYPYVIYPMGRVITKDHDAIFKKVAAKGTTIVLDSYASYTYPNAVKLPLKTDPRMDERTLRKPFRDWFTNRIDKIRTALPAWSDADFEGEQEAYTFVKDYEGVKYVTVVNNKRRANLGPKDPCVLMQFKTNAWYKPCGAPRRITTHFNVPRGSTVYEFNGKKVEFEVEKTGVKLAADYAAAEGKVFVVYPKGREPDEIKLDVGGNCAAGQQGWVDVTVKDDSGKVALGRQVIRLTLTAPDGTTRDESGLYAVHGKTRIPLRFAKGEQPGTFFKKWKVSVRELTTGLQESLSFSLK